MDHVDGSPRIICVTLNERLPGKPHWRCQQCGCEYVAVDGQTRLLCGPGKLIGLEVQMGEVAASAQPTCTKCGGPCAPVC
jgi:hypothetical protein